MRSPLLLAGLLAVGCVSRVAMAPDDRGYVERAWTGRERDQFLRLSFYVTPFFGDGGKRFLTAVPPDEVDLLRTPGEQVIPPGPVQRILPAGAPVRITRVEFPTSFVIPSRILYTPRTLTWVYLESPGEPGTPLILVMRAEIKTRQEAQAELERYLSAQDPKPILEAYSLPVREAIRKKQALIDMSSDALERAWGYPERKQIHFQEESRQEEWTYPQGKRRAFLQDDRVVRLEDAAAASGP